MFLDTMQKSLLLLLLSLNLLLAQEKKQVQLLNADELFSAVKNGQPVRVLKYNVAFKHENTFLYCDSAYQFQNRNLIEVFGNVRVNAEDGVTLTANRMIYDADAHKLVTFGNPAVFTKQDMKLIAPEIHYYTRAKTAYYFNDGEIITPQTRLKSNNAVFYSSNDSAVFTGNVRVQGKQFSLTTEKMAFLPKEEKTVFLAPANVLLENTRKLFVRKGYFLSQEKELFAYERPLYQDSSGTLEADTLFYNDSLKFGKALCDVHLWNEDSSIFIYGNFATWKNDTSYYMQITEAPFIFFIDTLEKDTTILVADTLVTFGRDSIEKLLAYPAAKMFNVELQMISDSMVYDRTQNLLTLYHNPVMWSMDYQLFGDTIYIWRKGNYPDSLYAAKHVLAAQHDSLDNYNQVSSDFLYAKFQGNNIRYMQFVKNCQAVYFVKDDSVYTGFNTSVSKQLRLDFKENKPWKIRLEGKPEGTFYPYKYRSDKTLVFLGRFRWLADKRPKKFF